jgi:hypothetical protein
LPVNIMLQSELWGGAHLEVEIRNDCLRSEKVQRTRSLEWTAVASGDFAHRGLVPLL